MAEETRPETIREYLYEIKVVYDEKSLDKSLSKITSSLEVFFEYINELFDKNKFDVGLPDIKGNKFYDKSAIDAMNYQKNERKALTKMYARMFDELADPHGDKVQLSAMKYEMDAVAEMANYYKKNNLIQALTMGGKGLLTKSVYAMVAYKVGERLYKGFKVVEKATIDSSNKIIDSNSMFIDKSIRDTMIKYGASSYQAIGMRKSMDILGISDEDMLKLTGGQARMYRDLMSQYVTGFKQIEPSQMERFNKAMQDYQSTMAGFKMNLQIQKMKFLAENADTIKTFFDFVGTIVELVGGVMDIIRPVASAAGFILNLPVKLLSDLGGAIKSNVSGHNIVVNQTNNNQVNGGDVYEVQDTISRTNQALLEMVGGNIE